MFCQPGKHSHFSVHRFQAALRTLLKFASVCILSVFAALGAQAILPSVVYVNDNTPANQVDAFYVNPNGTLKPVPGSPFATGGTAGDTAFDIDSIAISPGEFTWPSSRFSSYVYATNHGSINVSGFRINSDGSLSPVPGSPFADSDYPFGVAASADGRFLFVGLLLRGAIDVFRINGDGSLTLVPGSPFGVGGNGYDVLFDPRRNNVISDAEYDQVGVLHLDSGTGMLTPIPGSPFTTSTSNDQKMGLRPQGDLLFVAGGGTGGIDVLKVAPDGALSEAPGAPVATPESVNGTTVHPSGKYVYFGAGFSANIYGYVVGAGGTLTPVSGSPFASGGEGPTGLTTDNLGLFLFAVNTFGDSVTSFAIQRNGALASKGTVSLKGSGGFPSGIAFYGPPCPFCP